MIQPAKPAGRDRAMSAYNRYKEHTGGKPFDPRGRRPNHSNGKGSGRPPPQKGDGKDGERPNDRVGGGPKKNGGLRNAQKKQREKEAEETPLALRVAPRATAKARPSAPKTRPRPRNRRSRLPAAATSIQAMMMTCT